MKKIIISFFGVLFIGLFVTSCYKDIINPDSDPEGTPQSVSFKEDLAPLFKSKCTNAGCHVVGAHKPYLENPEVSFRNIVNGGFVNTFIPKESILYKQVYGAMTEFIPSKSDKQLVYDWIRNGAPNN
jgi:hypothetical protein